ncbi:hypothetical protein BGAL_0823g00030 [Botrytis galanthina]|uniref:Uncharacterized protein n=1 Tax=Botrytis galanthina TaxID=278940 RepID=A0A4S8QR23_9HELO|nr:hypothetical protein BGAL_0823g00030 [Botrytis galanthina]
MVRVGESLEIFKLLASWETCSAVGKLSKEAGTASVLLGRISRYLASMKLIKETGKDQCNLVGLMWADLQNFFASHKYQVMTDSNDT